MPPMVAPTVAAVELPMTPAAPAAAAGAGASAEAAAEAAAAVDGFASYRGWSWACLHQAWVHGTCSAPEPGKVRGRQRGCVGRRRRRQRRRHDQAVSAPRQPRAIDYSTLATLPRLSSRAPEAPTERTDDSTSHLQGLRPPLLCSEDGGSCKGDLSGQEAPGGAQRHVGRALEPCSRSEVPTTQRGATLDDGTPPSMLVARTGRQEGWHRAGAALAPAGQPPAGRQPQPLGSTHCIVS